MKQTAIFPGRYVQSEGALADLGDEVSRLGTRALIIAGGTAKDSLVPPFLARWSERLQLSVERFGGECSDQEIERLTQVAKQQACEVVVGMGGGTVIDTAKAVGYQAGARVGIVATIASTDAPASASAYLPRSQALASAMQATTISVWSPKVLVQTGKRSTTNRVELRQTPSWQRLRRRTWLAGSEGRKR